MANIVEKLRRRQALGITSAPTGGKDGEGGTAGGSVGGAAYESETPQRQSIVEKYRARQRAGITAYTPGKQGTGDAYGEDSLADFLTGSENKLREAAYEYASRKGYQTGEDMRALNAATNQTLMDVNADAKKARQYLYERRDLYGDDVYDRVVKLITEREGMKDSVRDTGVGASDYWGQFKDEGDYKAQVAAFEMARKKQTEAAAERERLLGLDTAGTRARMDEIGREMEALEQGRVIVPEEKGDMSAAEYSLSGWDSRKLLEARAKGRALPLPAAPQTVEALEKERAGLESDIMKAERMQKAEGYGALRSQADFAEVAAKGAAMDDKGWADGEANYRNYINDTGGAKSRTDEMARKQGTGNQYEKYAGMTREEKDTYNYLYAKEGPEAAKEYREAIDFDINERYMGALAERYTQQAEDMPVMSSIGSIAMAPGKMEGYLYSVGQQLQGKEIDPNSPRFRDTVAQAITRATVSGKIEEGIDSEWLGSAAAFLYQTGMSVADFATMNAVLGGLGAVGTVAQSAIMGAGAASDTTRDVLERGGTQQQALTAGTLAGAAELVFEKISLDNFVKLTNPAAKGALIKNALKQAGIEASEELATELANVIVDMGVMGDKSNYDEAIALYRAQGMDETEATRRARMDLASQVGMAALGGALSGGVTGTIGGIAGNIRTAGVGRELNRQGVAQDVLDSGMESAEGTLARQLAESGKTGNLALGRQHLANMEAIEAEGGSRTETVDAAQPLDTARRAAELADRDSINPVAFEGRLNEALAQNAGRNESIGQAIAEAEAMPRYGQRAYLPSAAELAKPEAAKTADTEAGEAAPEAGEAMPERAPSTVRVVERTPLHAGARQANGGMPVIVTGVKSIDGDRVTLTTADKGTIDMRDVYFDNEGTATLYRSAAKYTQRGAMALLDGFASSGSDAQMYMQGFDSFYRSGRAGLPFEDAQTSLYGEYMSPVAQRMAYDAGAAAKGEGRYAKQGEARPGADMKEAARPAERAAATEVATEVAREEDATRPDDTSAGEDADGGAREANEGPGLIRRSTATLDRQQEGYAAALDALAKKSGTRIVLEDTIRDVATVNGQPVLRTANGMYVTGTNEIHIALDAIEGGVMFAGMHELTHFVREFGAEQYEALRDFTLATVQKNDPGYDLEARIDALRAAQPELTREMAIEEIVADAMTAILTDEGAVRQLVRQDRTLAEKVRDFLNDFIAELKAVIGRIAGHGRPEIDALQKDADMLRVMAALFDDALEVAREGYEGYRSSGIQVAEGTRYSSEMDRVIREYYEAVDPGLLEMAEAYREDPRGKFEKKDIADVGDGLAKDIEALLGIDVSGYSHGINRNAFVHIERRHGQNGQQDRSMADLNDVARMRYVMENYDDASILRNEKGEQIFSSEFKDKNNKPASTIILKKRINGTYYLVESVVDGKNNRIWVNTAYIQKRGGTQVPNVQAPGYTSETELAYSPDNSIPQSGENENRDGVKRYSLNGESPLAGPSFARTGENADAAEGAAQALQRDYTRLRARGDMTLTSKALDRVAKQLLAGAKSGYDQQRLAAELGGLFSELQGVQDVNWPPVWDDLRRVARAVLEQSGRLDTTLYDEYADMRAYLRETGISLTETQKAEVASRYDSYERYRRDNFARLRLQSDGVSLDSIWGELSERWPQLFPADTHEAAQPQALADALDAVRKVYVAEQYDADAGAAANELALEMASAYMEATEAGRVEAGTKRAVSAYRDRLRQDYDAKIKAYQKQAIAERAALAQRLTKAEGEELAQLRERVKELVNQKAADRDALRKSFREWKKLDRARAREREARRIKKTAIERDATALRNWMKSPKGQKYVPPEMQSAVFSVLKALDFEGERRTKKGMEWREAMQALESRVLEMERDSMLNIDPDLVPEIQTLLDETQDKAARLGELEDEQLDRLAFITQSLRSTITKANELFANERYKTVDALGDSTIDELNKRKARKQDVPGIVRGVQDAVNYDMMDAFAFAEELGDAGKSMIEAIRRGHDKRTVRIHEASEYMAKETKGLKIREWSGKKAKAREYELGGKKVTMSPSNVMALYLSEKRAQARGHMYAGGFVVERDGKYQKGIRSDVVKVTPEQVKAATDTLTPEQRKLADAMFAYLQKMAAWGNEASRAMYGYDKFTEKDYFPIRTYDNYLQTKGTAGADSTNRIRNLGMTKATVKNASNPIVIGDVFDIFTRHVEDMATYSTMAAPLDDAMRWFNYQRVDISGDGADISYNGSVKMSIERAMGKAGKNYIVKLMKDLNGASESEAAAGWQSKLQSNAKVAAVGANVRVMVQQPTAYARAAAMISPKYLIAALGSVTHIGRNMALAKKYAPIALWKSLGFFETSLGTTMRDVIIGDGTLKERLQEWSLKPAGRLDDLTWGMLWNATEREVAETRRDLQRGSEAFYEAVGLRFSEIVDRTQVVDTVLHRSQIMRSKNALTNMTTSFMAEPMKTYNMLRSAIVEAARSNTPQARKKVARVGATFIMTTALTALAAGVVDAFRDDDDEKKWVEKYFSAVFGYGGDLGDVLGSNFVGGLNPAQFIPFSKELLSLLDGYSPQRMDMGAIEEMLNVGKSWIKYINGDSKHSAYKMTSMSVRALSKLTGIPAGALMRDLEAGINTVMPGALRMENETGTASATYQTMVAALLGGDKAKYGRLREAMVADGKTYKAIDAGVRSVLAGDEDTPGDARIEKAARARMAGDLTGYEAVVRTMKAEGFKQDIVIGAINNVITRLEKEPEEAKNVDEDKKKGLYGYDDLGRAVLAYDEADIDRIVESLRKDGKKDAGIRSAVTERVKPVYVEAVEKGRQAEAEKIEALLMNKFGYKETNFADWLDPEPYAELEAALEGGNAQTITGEIAALMDKGKSASAIQGKVTEAYKTAYLDSWAAGDTAGMRRVEAELGSLGYLNYEAKTFTGWIQDNIRGKLYDAIEAGNAQDARALAQQLMGEGVKAKSLLNSLANKYKSVYAGYYRAGDTARLTALHNMLLTMGLSEGTLAKWLAA